MGVKAWITVRGQHIPIMDGESKMQAVGNFFKSKRKDKATRLKEFNEKLQKHEGKEDYLKWGMKNYPVKTIYGNTLAETRKRNQEKYNELYEKNKERLKKYSKEELLERASGKIQTGDGERAYKKSWIEHDLAHYNTKKEFIPERDKYKGKSYKLKEDKPKHYNISLTNNKRTPFALSNEFKEAGPKNMQFQNGIRQILNDTTKYKSSTIEKRLEHFVNAMVKYPSDKGNWKVEKVNEGGNSYYSIYGQKYNTRRTYKITNKKTGKFINIYNEY